MAHVDYDISGKLRHYMRKAGLNSSRLAERAGVKASFVYDILNGKSANPSVQQLYQIAQVLGIQLDAFLGSGFPEPSSPQQQHAVQIPAVSHGKPCAASPYILADPACQAAPETIENLRSAVIQGDHMAPSLQPGDYVVVDTADTHPIPAGMFLCETDRIPVAHRLEQIPGTGAAHIRVYSDNPTYTAHLVAARDLVILGRIIWLGRMLHV